MPNARIDLLGAQADFVILDLGAAAWLRDPLPMLDALYFDCDASVLTDLYFMPRGIAYAADSRLRTPVIDAIAVRHAARSCWPIPLDAARVPYTLRITKPAGDAFVQLQWSLAGGGW